MFACGFAMLPPTATTATGERMQLAQHDSLQMSLAGTKIERERERERERELREREREREGTSFFFSSLLPLRLVYSISPKAVRRSSAWVYRH
jgi:hypothetical protein